MSDEGGLSKVIDSIGRLELGAKATVVLAFVAILLRGRNVHPAVRCFRIGLTTVLGLGVGYWRFG